MRPYGKHFSMRFALDDCRRAQFEPGEGDVLCRLYVNGTFQLCRVLEVHDGPKFRHAACVTMHWNDLEGDEQIYREVR